MTDLDRLSRFYGMPLPSLVLSARDEGLTDQETPDLFDAHLARNYGYFGALDKTLSGFVLLDDEGDDAWLYDARDTGAVYFQDHEERVFHPRLKSLEDYVAYRADKAKGADQKWFTQDLPAPKRLVSTPALGNRLQWAVWFFGQPMSRLPLEADRHGEDTAPGLLPDGIQLPRAFDTELPDLSNDPHLALFWLLLTKTLADEPRFTAAVAAAPKQALVDAFVRKLSAVGPSDTLEVLPSFRRRRARLLLAYANRVPDEPARNRLLLDSLAFDPDDRPLDKPVVVVGNLKLPSAEVRSTLMRLLPEGLARDVGLVLRAFLDQDPTPAESARRLVEQVATLPSSAGARRFELFCLAAPRAPDPALHLRVARRLLSDDPYHFSVLELAVNAAEALDDPEAPALRARQQALAAVRPLYNACTKQDDKDAVAAALAQLEARPAADRLLFAQRVLSAPEGFAWPAVDRSFIEVVRQPFPDHGLRLGRALSGVSFMALDRTVKLMRQMAPEPDEALAADLGVALAELRPASPDDPLEEMERNRAVKAISGWRATRHGPDALEELIGELERGDEPTREALINSALNPFDKDYIVSRLSDALALRAARVLVEIQAKGQPAERGPALSLFHSAGHQLFRFHHLGAETYLIEQLREASRERKDLIADLYAAVQGLGTPASRAALVDQLFRETSELWRLSDAIAGVWTPELHLQILAAIRAHPQAILGANHYCAALRVHVQKTEPMHELGALARELSAQDEAERVRLAYVVWEALVAAVGDCRLELARPLVASAEVLGKTGISDYHTIDRKQPWSNPFAEVDPAKLIAALAIEQAAAREAGTQSKRDGKPWLELSDNTLRLLARTAIGERLFHDAERGTIWALAPDRRFVFFDGFEVSPPPFQVLQEPLAGELFHLPESSTQGSTGRRSFWTKDAKQFVNLTRVGDKLLLQWGGNDGEFKSMGLTFDGEGAAQEALSRYVPSRGYREAGPWEVADKGPIVRALYVPPADGSAEYLAKPFATETDALYWETLTGPGKARLGRTKVHARPARRS